VIRVIQTQSGREDTESEGKDEAIQKLRENGNKKQGGVGAGGCEKEAKRKKASEKKECRRRRGGLT